MMRGMPQVRPQSKPIIVKISKLTYFHGCAQDTRGCRAAAGFGAACACRRKSFESHMQGAQVPCALPSRNKETARRRFLYFLAEAV